MGECVAVKIGDKEILSFWSFEKNMHSITAKKTCDLYL